MMNSIANNQSLTAGIDMLPESLPELASDPWELDRITAITEQVRRKHTHHTQHVARRKAYPRTTHIYRPASFEIRTALVLVWLLGIALCLLAWR